MQGRTLRQADDLSGRNPRRPWTHGWVAFEVLRRAGGELSFEAYEQLLFDPAEEILDLARRVPGQLNAFQDIKHIRCDIYRRAVLVNPRLPLSWYERSRCSLGRHRTDVPLDDFPDELQQPDVYMEGAVRRTAMNSYERDPRARRACIAAKGATCAVCGFSFADVYARTATPCCTGPLLR